MPTLYFVQHSYFPEERDTVHFTKEEAQKQLNESSKSLNGEVWLRAYDYELTEVGVKNLAERIAEEYCNNMKDT
ncbi:hypothetical protein N9370_01565 [Paracoccaceae bacterium]|nr:hypothetical protein [Paracoccaceae bacterium]